MSVVSQRKSCGKAYTYINKLTCSRYTAHHAETLKDLPDYGFDVTVKGFTWAKIKQSRDAYIERLRGIYHSNLEKDKVTEIVNHHMHSFLIT